jgi:hypothetical protein
VSFPAQYDSKGLCPAGCGHRLHAGDLIRKNDHGEYVHDECAPKPSKFDIGPREVICGSCWLVKPCRCDDD